MRHDHRISTINEAFTVAQGALGKRAAVRRGPQGICQVGVYDDGKFVLLAEGEGWEDVLGRVLKNPPGGAR